MKVCPKCGAQLADNVDFCTNCGNPFTNSAAPNQNPAGAYQSAPYGAAPAAGYNNQYAQQYAAPYDHTAEFTPQDISDNKVYAMLPYLMSIFGVIIALLASGDSPYARFHIRQAVKFSVVTVLMYLVAALTFWLLFIPVIAAGVISIILFVARIICFVQICKGKAVEPIIIRSLGFLK